MIRFILCSALLLAMLAGCAALGMIVRWDLAWCLLIVPTTALLGGNLAAHAVDLLNRWAFDRANDAAADYSRTRGNWHPQVQHRLNARRDYLARLVR